jgi:hypothetical protein
MDYFPCLHDEESQKHSGGLSEGVLLYVLTRND